MIGTITHPFVSAKADGPDASLVRPSNWNVGHTVAGVPDFNWTFNGDVEVWGAGAATAPTGWTLNGGGSSTAKNTTAGQFKVTAASADVTRAGTDCYLAQDVTVIPGFGPAARWQGKQVTLGVWVRATVASRARVGINDGVGSSFSSYHTGGSTFEFLTVSRTIDNAATKVEIRLQVDTGNTTAQFDGVVLVMGGSVTLTDFIPSGWRGRKATFTRGTTTAANQGQGTTEYLGVGRTATEAQATFRAPFKGVARNLHTLLDANVGGAAQSSVTTLRKDEATDTALTVTINTGAREGADVTNEVEIAKGTKLSIKSVLSATSGNLFTQAAFEFEEIP